MLDPPDEFLWWPCASKVRAYQEDRTGAETSGISIRAGLLVFRTSPSAGLTHNITHTP
jgi:hypothetical protein